MAWECADCGEKEKDKVKMPVCHHCGKPVCQRHREKITDDAFALVANTTTSPVAVHCLDCRRDFHVRATTNLESGIMPAPGGPVP